MDWFKRYGIPGAYSVGLTILWLIILYPCRIDLSEENTLKIMGGIFAGGFLPFGYLMCMVGEGYYYFRCCCSRRYGRHARARLISKVARTNNNPCNIEDWAVWAAKGIKMIRHPFIKWLRDLSYINWLINAGYIQLADHRINRIKKNIFGTLNEKEKILSACSVLEAVSKSGDPALDKDKFAQEWIRKRSDVIVINQAIIAATIVCPIGVWCLHFLPCWSIKSLYWGWLLIPVLFLLFVIWYVINFLRTQTDIVIAGVFNLRDRPNW